MTYLLVRYPERRVVFVTEEWDVMAQEIVRRVAVDLADSGGYEPVSNTYRVETVK